MKISSKKVAIKLIKGYRKTHFLQRQIAKTIFMTENICRFTPTCSEYTEEAIRKYGVKKGTLLGVKRVLRCNPATKGGYDPVP